MHSAFDSHDCCSCTSDAHRQRHRDIDAHSLADGRDTAGAGVADDADVAALESRPSASTLAADHRNSRRCCVDGESIASYRRCLSCCCRAWNW